MKKLRIFVVALLMFACTAFFAACNNDDKEAKIESVEINGLMHSYYVTQTVDYANMTLTVKYDNNTTKTLSKAEFDVDVSSAKADTEFVVNTDGLHDQTGDLTVGSYEFSCYVIGNETKFNLFTVEVNTDMSLVYSLETFDEPEFLTKFKSNTSTTSGESAFKVVDNVKYTVGDDNSFVITPKYLLADNDSNFVTEEDILLNLDVEVKEVNGQTLTPVEEGTAYTYSDHKIDFAETAVGKTFSIKVMPRDFDEDSSGNTIEPVEFTVEVQDGYNVYSALDLGLINIVSQSETVDNTYHRYTSQEIFYDIPTATYHTIHYNELWKNFLTQKGYTNLDKKVNGVFFHKDIEVNPQDLPEEYFVTAQESEYAKDSLRDFTFMYQHFLTDNNFVVNGNFFKLDLSNIPVGLSEGHHGNGLVIYTETQAKYESGHSAVFAFSGKRDNTTSYTASIVNLNSIGNIGDVLQKKDIEESELLKASGGLILSKSLASHGVVDNCITKNYMIGYFPEASKKGIDIKNTKVFDCFNSAVFVYWAEEGNITNCEFKRFGGPAIFLISSTTDTGDVSTGYGINEQANITVDSVSEIDCWLGGQEAWFVQQGGTGIANQLKTLDGLLNGYGKTMLNADDKFNLLSLGMDGGYLESKKSQLYNSIKIGDVNYSSYAEPFKTVAKTAGALRAPTFMTSDGSIYYFNGSGLSTPDGNPYTRPLTGDKLLISYPVGSTSVTILLGIQDKLPA